MHVKAFQHSSFSKELLQKILQMNIYSLEAYFYLQSKIIQAA